MNRGLTLMAGTGGHDAVDDETVVNLDPWHKMLVGWIEPRVVAIGKPGTAQLAAQHVPLNVEPERKRPLLIYDAKKGTSEFFLLEYRTLYRLGYDRNVATSGLVIWHVALGPNGWPKKIPSERKGCHGQTVDVVSLFVRGAPAWRQGFSKAYTSANGEIPLRWMDGTDTGVRITVAPHVPTDALITVRWSAPADTPPSGVAKGVQPPPQMQSPRPPVKPISSALR